MGPPDNIHLQCDLSCLGDRCYFHVPTSVLNGGSLSVQEGVWSEQLSLNCSRLS